MPTTPKPIVLPIDPKSESALWKVVDSIQELNKTETKPKADAKSDKPTFRKARGKEVLMTLVKSVCQYASDKTLASLVTDAEAAIGSSKEGEKPLGYLESVMEARTMAQTSIAPKTAEEAAQMIAAIKAAFPDLK